MAKLRAILKMFILLCIIFIQNIDGKSYLSVAQTVTTEEKEIIVFPEKLPFKKARDLCKSQGYHLLSVENEESNKIVYDLAVNNNVGKYWIDINDIKDEGTFLDTNGQRVVYKKFAQGEPNNLNNEDCVHGLFYPNGFWNDISCSDLNSVICSKEKSTDAEIRNATYQIYPRRVTYQEAFQICQKHNCRIVKINDENKNNIIFEMAKNAKLGTYWINGNDIVTEGKWLDSNGKGLKYLNWHQREPNNNKNEDCIQGYYFGDSTWNDISCDSKNAFIYEYGEYSKENTELVDKTTDVFGKYFVHTAKVTYQQALDYCHVHNCELVTIKNAQIDSTIMRLASKHTIETYWLDGTDSKVEGSWVNSEGINLTYLNWNEGEPNNWGNEDCLIGNYFGNGKWNDISCDSRNSFIYEFIERIVINTELIIITDSVTYKEAKSLCEMRGYDLVSIENEEINKRVYDFAKQNKIDSYWIDANDMKVEGTFLDNDGFRIKYSKFNRGEPNNEGNEDCVQGSHSLNSFWNDVSCTKQSSVICMKYPPPIITADEYTNYHIYNQKYTYAEAVKLCQSVEYDLLQIDDIEDNHAAQSLSIKYNLNSYWVDGTDSKKEGKWVYSHGEPLKFANWIKGGGSLDKEKNCIFSSKALKGKWEDVSCSSKHPVICYENSLELIEETFEEITYYIYEGKLTYKEALNYCKKNSCRLVTIRDIDTDIWLLNLAKSFKIGIYWIDGNDIKKEGLWVNSVGKVLKYFNWSKCHPTIDINKNCLVADSDSNGKWKDVPCDTKSSFIYQIIIEGEESCDDLFI